MDSAYAMEHAMRDCWNWLDLFGINDTLGTATEPDSFGATDSPRFEIPSASFGYILYIYIYVIYV